MNRRSTILVAGGLVIAGSLAVTAIAVAGSLANDRVGNLEGDPNTYFGFDLAKVNGHQRVKNVQFDAPFTCYNEGQGFITGGMPGSFRVKDGRFSGKTNGTLDAQPATFHVSGKRGTNGNWSGSFGFRASGPFVAKRGTVPDRCYTGTLTWKVGKPAV